MIKPEQIPDEVIKAAFNAAMLQPHNSHTGQMIAAVTAAINAWPGGNEKHSLILLPLPQEKNDD
jgi:hypothetical protein